MKIMSDRVEKYPFRHTIFHYFSKQQTFELFWDISSILEPLVANIDDVENNVGAILERNMVVDEQMQEMKIDIMSLSEKILSIKVCLLTVNL